MQVTSEIRTGSRRILDYIFSPLVQVGSEAMRER
jgi:hemolysin D